MKRELYCNSCGERHGVEVHDRINVGEDPELKDRVKDGSLFVWECPHCGASNLVPGQALYHDPDGKLMVWLLPEGAVSEALEGQLAAAAASLGDYVLRRVGDIGSLIEKVNIFDADLDDCAIEMCKYVSKLELSEKGSGIMDLPFKFFRLDGADNDLEFSYPKDGRMHGIRIGFNVYEDCAGILARNPSVKPAPGFSKVDQEWVNRFFR